MSETTYKATSCPSCGAPLEPPEGRSVVECSYCGRKLEVEGEKTRQVDEGSARSLTDKLLQGYGGSDYGEGKRYGVVDMRARDWKCWERGVWPIEGCASSSFGTGWAARAVVGAPRVYPRCGDRMGAWAPGTARSHVEWIEARYPSGAPPVKAIRVFETCVPGATYAVTAREDGDHELLWEGKPTRMGNTAQVLEIRVDPPRKLSAVRAYVSNSLGNQWTEIDTIGLVAPEPIPVAMRRKPPRFRPAHKALLIAAIAGAAIFLAASICSTAELNEESETPELASPVESVTGAVMKVWQTDVAGMTDAGTVWASTAVGRSSAYGKDDWSAARALGPPDVFPAHLDSKQAWAPRQQNRGQEWITVGFAGVKNAGSVIVVETLNPGALVRIDDLSDPDAPVVLWRGTTSAPGKSRILSLELPEPRNISRLRLVLDTKRVAGWNEIDAIGLVPRRE